METCRYPYAILQTTTSYIPYLIETIWSNTIVIVIATIFRSLFRRQYLQVYYSSLTCWCCRVALSGTLIFQFMCILPKINLEGQIIIKTSPLLRDGWSHSKPKGWLLKIPSMRFSSYFSYNDPSSAHAVSNISAIAYLNDMDWSDIHFDFFSGQSTKMECWRGACLHYENRRLQWKWT